MIEENALNEKSCVQVMRILLTKADAEIHELEKDLVLLQSELVWAEHEEWSDICCNALRAKINCLDFSIRKLGNKDENDFEVYLQMLEEPPEELHKIMQALLKTFFHRKNEQNEQSQDAVLDSMSLSPEQLATLRKNQISSTSNTCFTSREEKNGPGVTPQENFTSSISSTELEVEKANSSETDEQPANAMVKDFAHKQITFHSNEMRNLSKDDLKFNECEVQGCYATTTGEIKISNSYLNPEHKENIQIADKHATSAVKSPDTLRHAIGLDGEENSFDSRLGAFGQAEGPKIDMEQKPCDFAVKSLRKRGTKELKVASSDKKRTLNSLFMGEGKNKKKDSLLVVKLENADLSDNKHSALTSLVEMQDEKGKDKTIQDTEGNPKLEEVQIAEIAASDDKLVMNLYMRPQNRKLKTNIESISASVEDPCLNSRDKISNSSSFSKGNRSWKDANSHTLNCLLSGKIKKTIHHSQCEAEVRSMMLDSSQNTMPLPQKKCEKVSSVPTVAEIKGSSFQMNISKMQGKLNRSTTKTDIGKSEASADGSCTMGLALLHFNSSNLMNLKLRDLKAIAKEQKIKKYLTLSKKDLIKQLENQFSS